MLYLVKSCDLFLLHHLYIALNAELFSVSLIFKQSKAYNITEYFLEIDSFAVCNRKTIYFSVCLRYTMDTEGDYND